MISPDPPTTRRATAKIFRLPWKLKCTQDQESHVGKTRVREIPKCTCLKWASVLMTTLCCSSAACPMASCCLALTNTQVHTVVLHRLKLRCKLSPSGKLRIQQQGFFLGGGETTGLGLQGPWAWVLKQFRFLIYVTPNKLLTRPLWC